MRDENGNEEMVDVGEFCERTIKNALNACIGVLEHGTAFDRVSFIGLMKQGINRVIALPIDEVID